MPRKQGKEEDVYPAVVMGELTIDEEGRIWRVAKRGWSRWERKTVTRPCKRVRAEHDTGDYLMIRVMFNGVRHHCQASRLVYRHFYGIIPKLMTVNHKDGDKKRNHPKNLELATDTEQVLHALHVLKRGRIDQNGEKNAMAKLTRESVREILSMKPIIEADIKTRHGREISKLAKKYGVSYNAVWEVLKGNHWTS